MAVIATNAKTMRNALRRPTIGFRVAAPEDRVIAVAPIIAASAATIAPHAAHDAAAAAQLAPQDAQQTELMPPRYALTRAKPRV